MSFFDFILNGGLCGYESGYDHEEAGHPYGFDDLQDTIHRFSSCCDELPGRQIDEDDKEEDEDD